MPHKIISHQFDISCITVKTSSISYLYLLILNWGSNSCKYHVITKVSKSIFLTIYLKVTRICLFWVFCYLLNVILSEGFHWIVSFTVFLSWSVVKALISADRDMIFKWTRCHLKQMSVAGCVSLFFSTDDPSKGRVHIVLVNSPPKSIAVRWLSRFNQLCVHLSLSSLPYHWAAQGCLSGQLDTQGLIAGVGWAGRDASGRGSVTLILLIGRGYRRYCEPGIGESY